ncbi:ketoacyl-ACP synthase III [uncultured Winogradskyella sp.]|uniref:3-oxoacyl-ACP synthase III family protein n=1 Tax=uncultured Winogradskyella sp. TaxID=395353 RepID=UPI002611394E|nr:ketoacyl-ACP synthase III [uncultured Winogradskyella sp.]
MNLKFRNKKISGILTVLPENEVKFDDEIDNYNFSKSQSMKLKLVMGYDKRRIVIGGTTASDLCVYGMNYLFDQNLLHKDEIDVLILVTQSPDYFMPPTSHVIHGQLDLKQDMICMDINQGCSGYVVGLNQAFMLLEHEEINKVVLLNADVLSPKVSKRDRNSNPIIGDGASITIVENDASGKAIFSAVKVDGKGSEALIIPAGGFRTPSTSETAEPREDDAGNFRALDHLKMKGDDVFNFVQREVPPMIEGLLLKADLDKEDIDYYMFHQPNRFMLRKLADKIGVPYEKMPNNIVENFGNSSGVSIPTTITYNLGDKLLKDSFLICMAGFGTGLNWASLVMNLEKLQFCELINYK